MEIINISGEIGYELTPDMVKEQLKAANGADIDIHIASPGGYVSDGLVIYNAIRDYKRKNPGAEIMATIKGIAASMATYIASNPAIDMVAAEDNAVFMIHNVWGGAVGDYRDMQKSAEIFEGLTDIIATAYSQKTKKEKAEIRTDMDNETWLFGDEIKKYGFVDDMIKTDEKKEKAHAVAEAKLKFKSVSDKLNAEKIPVEQIAAMIRPENAQNPAEISAGKNKTTPEVTMTLSEFLSQNPAAKVEHDGLIAAHGEAQFKAGQESMKERMSSASKYLAPDSAYPSAIKSIAVDVLNCNKSVESLETTVLAFDALKESGKSASAQAETAKVGETPAEQSPEITASGDIKTDADYQAEIARTKKAMGREV